MISRASMGKQVAQPPWKKAPPKGNKPDKLTPQQKAGAKAAAKRAGQPYPSLVANMNAVRKAQGRGR